MQEYALRQLQEVQGSLVAIQMKLADLSNTLAAVDMAGRGLHPSGTRDIQFVFTVERLLEADVLLKYARDAVTHAAASLPMIE